jgi:hypothetical protein
MLRSRYVVNMADAQWRADAKTIDQSPGLLMQIRGSLESISQAVSHFRGTVAAGGSVRYIFPVNNTATG